jgi:superfamily I DNA and RNA helicase
MTSSYYKQDGIDNKINKIFIKKLETFIKTSEEQFYLITKPLSEKKYTYKYSDKALVLLVPKHKIMFINLNDDSEAFEDYVYDFIEDLGTLSDKFGYREYIGRPKKWKLLVNDEIDKEASIEAILKENEINDTTQEKTCELLISLLTGSINDIQKVQGGVPQNILDKVKQKIILFDGDQTRFIYQKKDKSRITIQGLSGTGKTELLLHKLKEIYTSYKNSKILFTCHNKILASSLADRIPKFFTFMKVEEQIEWEKRLWVINAWGSRRYIHSGAYRYICDFYNLDFYTFNQATFDKACQIALKSIKEIRENTNENEFSYAFDYILIDESQDFPESFFQLCEEVTKKSVYIAGDIFQNIFEMNVGNDTIPDYLLNQCYRTDPKTLMFAHSIGMGLLEEKKINWLSDEGWESCGYTINKEENTYLLSRSPIRRFADLDDSDIESIKLVLRKDIPLVERILNILTDIKSENETVESDDIAIMFVGSNKSMYEIADILETIIPDKFGWDVNKAYESREKIENTLLISNHNNVKGLEFPFVICIIDTLKSDLKFRNSLYMMLTRSFIQSYLLIKETDNIHRIQTGLNEINLNKHIKTTKPTEEELKTIKETIIQYNSESNKSWKDFLQDIFEECKVEKLENKKILEDMINQNPSLKMNFDREKLTDFVYKTQDFL